jgi:serine/threonine protein kinase
MHDPQTEASAPPLTSGADTPPPPRRHPAEHTHVVEELRDQDATCLHHEASGEDVPAQEVTADYGRYRVLKEHARGGLGRISLARDTKLGRLVALKEIRDDRRTSTDATARFIHEAAITGMLEHPGIVPIYALEEDANGKPYYTMRFIQGKTLSQAIKTYHAQPTELAFRDLLQRFIAVCKTLAYAHSKGVLHRDLKPDNVMVGDYGETLVVDWGLAKLLGRRGGEGVATEPTSQEHTPSHDPATLSSHHTREGAVLGTPCYMAPEQARGDLAALCPASDTYALGAILYALLTGKTPYPGSAFDALGMVRLGIPPRPPSLLNPRVPKPLEAICLKAMAPQIENRYANAQELAAEIERYLADEPVQAHAEPWWTKVRRSLRKRKALTASLLVAGLALLLLLGTVTYMAEQARQQAVQDQARIEEQRRRAEEKTQETQLALDGTQKILNFLTKEVLGAARPEGEEGGKGHNISLKEALIKAAPQIPTLFQGQPKLEAHVRHTLGYTLALLGEHRLAQEQAEAELALVLHLYGPHDPRAWDIQYNLATSLMELGEQRQAEALCQHVLQLREARLGADHPKTLESLLLQANLLSRKGQFAEAEKCCRLALQRQQARSQADQGFTYRLQHALAIMLVNQSRFREAEPYFRAALAGRQTLLGKEHGDTLASEQGLADVLQNVGGVREAEAIYRRHWKLRQSKLGKDHPVTLYTALHLATILLNEGRLGEALPLLREILQGQTTKLGVDHPDTLKTLYCLATALAGSGDFTTAETYCRQVLAVQEAKFGREHPDTLGTRHTLGLILHRRGKSAEAEPIFREVLASQQTKLGPYHMDTIVTQHNLGWALLRQYKLAEAEKCWLAAYQASRQMRGQPQWQRQLIDNLLKLYAYQRKSTELAAWRGRLVVSVLEEHPAWLLMWGWPLVR